MYTQSRTFTKTAQLLMSLFFLLSALLVSAQNNYFVPSVKGSVVTFGPAPAITRDSGVHLIMVGPNDFVYEESFSPGETVFFNSKDDVGGTIEDGQYSYEITYLTFTRNIGVRGSTPVDLEGKDNDALRRSGTLSINAGIWLNPAAQENGVGRDQTINDDLVVVGSVCVGLDCTNNESFDFDTLRIKENNTRIRFFDTSNSASFPGTDWELVANDSTNGGANKFGILDLDNNNEIFVVEAGAPANSLLVDDRGRVGFGTSTPLLDQHILSGNTPATRFQQDGSGGFPSQTWDIGGNETEFFIRDFSNSQVPFSIEPGAPSDSLVINSAGDIEITGTIVNVPGINLRNKVLSPKGQKELMGLPELESYITTNQSLPGLDDTSGDLVELQLKMLEKIQELTLYTIEQEKRIAELEAKLTDQ